jgi:hypothetical protein
VPTDGPGGAHPAIRCHPRRSHPPWPSRPQGCARDQESPALRVGLPGCEKTQRRHHCQCHHCQRHHCQRHHCQHHHCLCASVLGGLAAGAIAVPGTHGCSRRHAPLVPPSAGQTVGPPPSRGRAPARPCCRSRGQRPEAREGSARDHARSASRHCWWPVARRRRRSPGLRPCLRRGRRRRPCWPRPQRLPRSRHPAHRAHRRRRHGCRAGARRRPHGPVRARRPSRCHPRGAAGRRRGRGQSGPVQGSRAVGLKGRLRALRGACVRVFACVHVCVSACVGVCTLGSGHGCDQVRSRAIAPLLGRATLPSRVCAVGAGGEFSCPSPCTPWCGVRGAGCRVRSRANTHAYMGASKHSYMRRGSSALLRVGCTSLQQLHSGCLRACGKAMRVKDRRSAHASECARRLRAGVRVADLYSQKKQA